jgi:hypothetical protein
VRVRLIWSNRNSLCILSLTTTSDGALTLFGNTGGTSITASASAEQPAP